MKYNRDQLIDKVTVLLKEHEGRPDYLQRICDDLNKADVSTLFGGVWKAPNLHRFIRTHGIAATVEKKVEQLLDDEMIPEFKRVRQIKGDELKKLLQAAQWLSQVSHVVEELDPDKDYRVVPVILSVGLLEDITVKMTERKTRPSWSQIITDQLVKWAELEPEEWNEEEGAEKEIK